MNKLVATMNEITMPNKKLILPGLLYVSAVYPFFLAVLGIFSIGMAYHFPNPIENGISLAISIAININLGVLCIYLASIVKNYHSGNTQPRRLLQVFQNWLWLYCAIYVCYWVHTQFVQFRAVIEGQKGFFGAASTSLEAFQLLPFIIAMLLLLDLFAGPSKSAKQLSS